MQRRTCPACVCVCGHCPCSVCVCATMGDTPIRSNGYTQPTHHPHNPHTIARYIHTCTRQYASRRPVLPIISMYITIPYIFPCILPPPSLTITILTTLYLYPPYPHFPTFSRTTRYATSSKGKLVDVFDFVQGLPDDEPLVFSIGAMAHGSIDEIASEYSEELLSFSQYPLSAACVISRLMAAFERHWGIV